MTEPSDGVQRGAYESGAPQWECEYKNGERHGTLRWWFEDGMLQSQREYLHGMKHGAFMDFHPDGRRAAEGEYRSDEIVAVREWDADGNEVPDALERWQENLAAAERIAASPGSEMLDPAWQARQAELGEVFLGLWLLPWSKKRELMQQVPELADTTRHMFLRAMMARMEGAEAAAVLGAAHQPLIDRCDESVRAALAAGTDIAASIDEVFDDHHLWLEFHELTGQPQE